MYLFPPIYSKTHRLHLFNCEYGEKVLIAVHRDLKPENVLYKTQSHHSPIVIADFGIAKHLEYDVPETTTISPSSTISDSSSPRKPLGIEGKGVDDEKEGEGKAKEEDEPREGGVDSFAGSFGYTAPEVLLGLRHGLKVDCWSIGYVPLSSSSSPLLPLLLGTGYLLRIHTKGKSSRCELNNRVIAYTLLCGYSPFRSDDKAALVEETKRGKVVFHERYWRKVSDTGKSEPVRIRAEGSSKSQKWTRRGRRKE
jgi:calcium/calmodulin-dependent protein kinase I